MMNQWPEVRKWVDSQVATKKFQFSKLEAQKINEDAPTNNVGGGQIAGTTGDPPMGRKAQKKWVAQNESHEQFAGHAVFEVDSDTMHKGRLGKHPRHRYAKYVGEDETGQKIREYGRANPKKSIILKDGKTGAMVFLRRGEIKEGQQPTDDMIGGPPPEEKDEIQLGFMDNDGYLNPIPEAKRQK
jgi:hypothetical protein